MKESKIHVCVYTANQELALFPGPIFRMSLGTRLTKNLRLQICESAFTIIRVM